MTTEIQVSVVGKTGLRAEQLNIWLVSRGNVEDWGVRRAYVIQLASDFDLTTDDLHTVLATRKSYRASLPAVRRWLNHGLDAAGINDLYRTREEMRSVLGNDENQVTLKSVVKFVETFAEFSLEDEDLSEKLVEIFHEVAGLQFCYWVRSVSQVIDLLCTVASKKHVSNVGAAIDFLRTDSHAGRDSDGRN